MNSLWNTVDRVAGRLAPTFPVTAARLSLTSYRRSGEEEFSFLRSWVEPATIAIDIGVNWGPYTGELLRLGCQVVGFEANPSMARRASQSWPKAVIHDVALGDRPGMAQLHIPRVNGQSLDGWASIAARPHGEGDDVKVEVRTLDSYDLRNVGFIKIDVEGHELPVIEGAMQTIARDRPTMLIESEEQHAPGCPNAMVDRLAQLGYEASFIHRGQVRPFADWSPTLLNRSGRTINNFLLRPMERGL